ncbi:unnamed protein product [Rangifer tarandus platyrhynchus]|uniref:Uncharacterized protein n=2 Tax=Rangifer tarandus platyrhynchus TaxID=3082113 RepID=A0ACB0EIU8_RANTA|nr:unnamed protein product [Rangifer tarandus platyrhynchus]CAI9700299.1 unnamed protein product [Rangifer tarandus platyrhynchus]
MPGAGHRARQWRWPGGRVRGPAPAVQPLAPVRGDEGRGIVVLHVNVPRRRAGLPDPCLQLPDPVSTHRSRGPGAALADGVRLLEPLCATGGERLLLLLRPLPDAHLCSAGGQLLAGAPHLRSEVQPWVAGQFQPVKDMLTGRGSPPQVPAACPERTHTDRVLFHICDTSGLEEQQLTLGHCCVDTPHPVRTTLATRCVRGVAAAVKSAALQCQNTTGGRPHPRGGDPAGGVWMTAQHSGASERLRNLRLRSV